MLWVPLRFERKKALDKPQNKSYKRFPNKNYSNYF